MPINRVRHSGTQKGQVQADLVGAPGEGMGFEQGVRGKGLKGEVFGNRFTPFFISDNRHLLAVGWVPPNRRFDPPGGCGRMAIHQGQVYFLYLAQAKLILQPAVSAFVLGDQDQPGGIFIQAVDHPRALFAADAFHLRGMRQGGMHQRAGGMPGWDGPPCRPVY